MGPIAPPEPKNRGLVEVFVVLLAHAMGRCLAEGGSAKRTGTVPASANAFLHSGAYKFAGFVLYTH
jgi:hypothetical protein